MRWWRELGPVGSLATLAVAVPPISGVLLLGTLNQVGPWLREQQEVGLALYLVAFTLLGGLALLPTYAQSVLGGWAFGFWAGLPIVLAGFVGAALVGYLVSSRVAGHRVEQLVSGHARWRVVHEALLKGRFWKTTFVATLLRLPPNAPFAATNVTMAALGVPVVPYAIGTVVGLAPRVGAVVYAAAGLAVLDLRNREQVWSFAVSLGITLAVVAILSVMAALALRRLESASGARDATRP